MTRVIVYCEGPTEETFVKRILAPAFWNRNIFLSASSCNGVSKYSIIKRDLSALCRHDPNSVITTMLDYYGLPWDTPGIRDIITGTVYDKVAHVEASIREDMGVDNLIPNLMLHEFESLLFSDPDCFSCCGLPAGKMDALRRIRETAETPEHINNGPNTAPSKRILRIYPEYDKVLDGFHIAQDIGLHVMRRECRHFDGWMNKIDALEPRR